MLSSFGLATWNDAQSGGGDLFGFWKLNVSGPPPGPRAMLSRLVNPGRRREKMTGRVRIISGQWRRRLVQVPDVDGLRPTPDRVRETLFNWLAGVIEGARCLDLYAGSGALGFEAASRGAERVLLVEKDQRAVACMRQTASALGAKGVEILQADVRHWIERDATPFDIVFLDPPYGSDNLGELCAALERRAWLAAGALVYLETRATSQPIDLPPGWDLLRRQKAGQVRYHLAAAGDAMRQDR
jgi:16S rRNA (guanine966-N2)-methyltransferase